MSLLKKFLRNFKFVRRLERRVADLEQTSTLMRAELAQAHADTAEWRRFSPPGHFYSPLPSQAEVSEAFARGGFGPPFAGVDLNEAEQLSVLEKIAGYYPEQPFPTHQSEGWRFYLDNPSYGHFDAIMLYGMLRHLQPKRIIEVGSGFSSAAMLDLNERSFGGSLSLTFIDPDMSRLKPLLRLDDHARVTLIERKVQDVPLDAFAALEANDVLFIDSSHVAKIGSDVNRLFFDVLPALRPGVRVHIHDIAGNLEYPRDWFAQGRAWSEQYLLRAFLMFNHSWRIELFSTWLSDTQSAFFHQRLPLCTRGGGGQLWMRRES